MPNKIKIYTLLRFLDGKIISCNIGQREKLDEIRKQWIKLPGRVLYRPFKVSDTEICERLMFEREP